MNKEEKIKLLYIDDEINNLNGFKASFRFDYIVLIALTVDEALEHLKNHPDIRVILCDQRMPVQTGVQFFESIRNTYPNPIRILITAYTDIESVIDAINRGNIFRYIKKPWTETDIQSAVEEANKFYTANTMLSLKNEELQKAYNELDKFSYSVTHDMRGPLLSILGAVDLARHIDDINEIKEILGMMEKSVQKLDDFIRSIHEYYSLKRGELDITDIDFNALVKDLIDMYEITERMNQVHFTTGVAQTETFRSDLMYIKIILNNLLSNAFKYQRKDISDRFVDLKIESCKGSIVITVSDNGIGIHENYIQDIFKMFYRATSESVGSGFGLYNVKDALTKLNGEIHVDSKPNEGTRFKVIIPSK